MHIGPLYTDAHLHVLDYIDLCKTTNLCGYRFAKATSFCCSAHTADEFEKQWSCVHELFTEDSSTKGSLLFSFGIHPQNPVETDAIFLHYLLESKRIHAIGECGFDLFNDTYRQSIQAQRTVWDVQLQLAISFSVPIVIHCRKALHLIFKSAPRLKKIPAVIFHGWSGSIQEAHSLLKKGVNAYFSLGKALLRKQKTVCAMAAEFDLNRLLTETDAPYMQLKNEAFSHPQDIIPVARHFAVLRNVVSDSEITGEDEHSEAFSAFLLRLADNFCHAFCIA